MNPSIAASVVLALGSLVLLRWTMGRLAANKARGVSDEGALQTWRRLALLLVVVDAPLQGAWIFLYAWGSGNSAVVSVIVGLVGLVVGSLALTILGRSMSPARSRAPVFAGGA